MIYSIKKTLNKEIKKRAKYDQTCVMLFRLNDGIHSDQSSLMSVLDRTRRVDDVKVDQLLQLDRGRLHALDHVREERRDVLADRHHGDDLLGGLLPLFSLV